MIARAVFKVIRQDSPAALKRQGRQYVIIVEAHGDINRVTIYRGGYGRSMYIDWTAFGSYEDMLEDVQIKVRRRFNHGYSLIWWDRDFPLLEWMKNRHYLIERQPLLPPPIQLFLPTYQ